MSPKGLRVRSDRERATYVRIRTYVAKGRHLSLGWARTHTTYVHTQREGEGDGGEEHTYVRTPGEHGEQVHTYVRTDARNDTGRGEEEAFLRPQAPEQPSRAVRPSSAAPGLPSPAILSPRPQDCLPPQSAQAEAASVKSLAESILFAGLLHSRGTRTGAGGAGSLGCMSSGSSGGQRPKTPQGYRSCVSHLERAIMPYTNVFSIM